jgi:anti-anti-sigma factor
MVTDKADIQITGEGPVAVVSFTTPSLSDVDSIAVISSRIKDYIHKAQPTTVIFDLDKVKFFSSQVLGLMLETRAALQPINGRVVISSVCPQLYRVFEITNLNQIFTFFPDRQAAMKAC